MTFHYVSVSLNFDAKQMQLLESIPALLKQQVAAKCLEAAGAVVAQRAKALAPSSQRSGSRGSGGSKWGLKAAKKFSGRASMLQHTSGDHISYKVLTKGKFPSVLIGAKWSEGAKQQFNYSPDGREVYYWGRKMGKNRKKDSPDFLVKAWQETQATMLYAFKAQLAKQIKELNLG
jgi:hypothetical protein